MLFETVVRESYSGKVIFKQEKWWSEPWESSYLADINISSQGKRPSAHHQKAFDCRQAVFREGWKHLQNVPVDWACILAPLPSSWQELSLRPDMVGANHVSPRMESHGTHLVLPARRRTDQTYSWKQSSKPNPASADSQMCKHEK